MTCEQRLLILSKFENLRDLIQLTVRGADGRFLQEITTKLSDIQVEVWLEQDRRGRRWARPGEGAESEVTSNTAKFAL